MHATGFVTEEALSRHHQEEHVKPNEDPVRFMKENFALAMGLDLQGNPILPSKGNGQDANQFGAPPMGMSLSKQGQTPMSRPDSAATPMSRDASMRRQASAGVKGPETTGTPGRSQNTPRLAEVKLAEGPQMAVMEDPWANSTIDPQSLFAGFAPLESMNGNIFSDISAYRSVTPNDTPESSKDSGASEPNSDIAEGAHLDIDLNWQPIDTDLLLDMNNVNMEGYESLDHDMLGSDPMQFSSLDDMTTDFSKPFQFDTSLYSMDAS